MRKDRQSQPLLGGGRPPLAHEHLAGCVAGEIQQRLRDDAEQPRYLTGERRRGYRILAPVVRLEPQPLPEVAPAAALPAAAAG